MSLSQETIAAVRFGYGLRPGEPAVAEPEALLAGVRAGAGERDPEEPGLAARSARFLRIREAAERGEDKTPPSTRYRAIYQADVERRVARATLSPHGFHERLVWFWADHFTVVGRNQRGRMTAPSFEAEAIRPNVAGSFGALLKAAVTHPVMLVYLDQFQSIGPGSPVGRRHGRGLNENLAREVLELHTLGVGADYGQADVRQFAELLTGLGAGLSTGRMVFRAPRAEPGAETVLGRRYGGGAAGVADIHAALDDLALHPATARHVATKLAVHFLADEPPPGLVDHLEGAYRRSDGALMAVYAALLEHPASWTEPGAKVRQPFDFLVATLRAAGARGPADVAAAFAGGPPCAGVLRGLNQPLWGARGPDGWPEAAEAWITPPGLTGRINWASRLGVKLAERTDPRTFLADGLGPRASAETTAVVRGAAERWEGIALVLASPEFNRR
jgi:uncharacterized protein (DUF1800 family)